MIEPKYAAMNISMQDIPRLAVVSTKAYSLRSEHAILWGKGSRGIISVTFHTPEMLSLFVPFRVVTAPKT
jgi:hypothetical protein